MTDRLLKEMQDGLLILRMNRPQRRNALDAELALALRDATMMAADDPAVRTVLLCGAGGHFCVGGDVREMNAGRGRERPAAERRHALRDRMSVSKALHEMEKPTIAAIEGSAAGAGLAMALACDLRICALDARLTTAFARVGLSGDYGGTFFLTHLIGAAKARELYLTSPILSGREAAELGLVSRAVPAAETFAAALALARDLAAGPTLAYARIKANIAAAQAGRSLGECLDLEARNFVRSTETEDHREAAAAFVEKRAPAFLGR